MNMMRRISSLLILSAVFSAVAFAQAKKDVSEEELKQFASAFMQVQSLNKQVQQDMVNTVEDEGLNVKRYSEIQQAQQDTSLESGTTTKELENYESATQKLKKVQVQARQEMKAKIIEEGLTINRYEEIAAIIQNDTELQQWLSEYLQG